MLALVTGATGFIGTQLVQALRQREDRVVVLTRRADASCDGDAERRFADLTQIETLKGTCAGIDVVFHLAGYAHADDANDDSAQAVHWRVTVEGTRGLLEEARRAGVKRIVFVSSIKAMGEGDPRCLDEASSARPETAYGRAKLAAEELLLAAGGSGMEICILRLPLVYGRDNKGNIPRMIAAIDRGRFPPLPDVPNKRSMVHVDDVVQALLLAAQRPEAVGRTYIVTDGQTYSTRQIYAAICDALGRPVPRWSVPMPILRFGARVGDAIARVSGKPFPLTSTALEKLVGSAWYSSGKIGRELGFVPRRTLETALPEMVARHRERTAGAA